MYALKTWRNSGIEISRKLQADRDIVALLANFDAQKEQMKALTAAVRVGKSKRGYLSLHENGKPKKAAGNI